MAIPHCLFRDRNDFAGRSPRSGAAAFMASDLVEFFSADFTTYLEAVRLINGARATGQAQAMADQLRLVCCHLHLSL